MNEQHPGRFGIEEGSDSTEPDETVAEPRLPVAACAQALRITPATLRRYIVDHGAHLDVVRHGRTLMVAVGSIPALARIRDLRARKIGKDDIDRLLTALPEDIALAELNPPATPASEGTTEETAKKMLDELRREFVKLKEELRDNDVLVRQSLANVLFLVERCHKDIQFFASEERIASKERDLHLTEVEREYRRLSTYSRRERGLFANLLARYRQMLGMAFSR